jgi:hypothetical protein
MEGADVYQIAKNCRTSVQMIEEFYASHIKNMMDASVINVRRSRTPRGDRPKPKRRSPESARKFHKTSPILDFDLILGCLMFAR